MKNFRGQKSSFVSLKECFLKKIILIFAKIRHCYFLTGVVLQILPLAEYSNCDSQRSFKIQRSNLQLLMVDLG